MKTPSSTELLAAAEWLDCYEDDDNTAKSIKKVADWLRIQADEYEFRQSCIDAGVTLKVARKARRISERTKT